MRFFTLFFGLLFLIIGINIILSIFKINIPLMRIFFGCFLIYVGLMVITRKPFFGFMHCCNNWGNSDVFCDNSYDLKNKQIEYEKINVVFGNKNVDLTGITIKGSKAYMKLDCVFGGMKVILDKSIPVRIVGNSVFGQVIMPDNNNASFGSAKYLSPGFSETKPYLDVEASVVFGELIIR